MEEKSKVYFRIDILLKTIWLTVLYSLNIFHFWFHGLALKPGKAPLGCKRLTLSQSFCLFKDCLEARERARSVLPRQREAASQGVTLFNSGSERSPSQSVSPKYKFTFRGWDHGSILSSSTQCVILTKTPSAAGGSLSWGRSLSRRSWWLLSTKFRLMFCERGLHHQAQIAWEAFPASEGCACEKECTKQRGGGAEPAWAL